ncbi:MAG: TatD family hydrolase [Bacteroidales bacterium]
MMEFTDTHCHLFLPEFDPDREAVIGRALEAGVTRMVLPNVDSTTVTALRETACRWPENCFPLMGLHPTSVDAGFEKELALVENWLNEGVYYGIGETGLDLYWDKTWIEQQKEAFRVQLGWASSRQLPVVIHVRDSLRETIEVIRQSGLSGLKGVFHCFTGSVEDARAVIDLGFHLGIGGVSTFKNGGLDQVLPDIDPTHLVLETDSPYLAPVPHRGKRNEPAYLPLIAGQVARIYGTTAGHIAELTSENAKTLFRV